MNTPKNTFRPEDIDADIDQLLKTRHQRDHVSHPKARLVSEMKDLYARERYEDESQILDRAWEQLSQQIQRPLAKMAESPEQYQRRREFNQPIVLKSTQKSATKRRLMQVGLGLVAAFVLVSTMVMFTVAQQHRMGVASNHSTPAANHTTSPSGNNASQGHVIFRSQSADGEAWVNWPAAGPRLIEVVTRQNTIFGGTMKIVDAKTNQTYASIPLDSDEQVNMPGSWSPVDDMVAIATNKRVIIVNGQTGQIMTSHWSSTLAFTTPEKPTVALSSMAIPLSYSSTQSHLRALASASSFRGIAWSPDGKSIASSYSSGAAQGNSPSAIDVWNPTTGIVSNSFHTDPGWSVAEISWSSDGKYIAANMSKGLTQNQVVVWNAKTRQIVFQHAVSQELSGSSWQPGTHNLAFSLLVRGNFEGDVMNVWNIDAKALLKTFPGVTASEMAWSPNGNEIAYNTMIGGGKTDVVAILNIKDGQKSSTYQASAPSQHIINIASITWSPDGKYILTCETTTSVPSGNGPQPPRIPSHSVVVWEP
ncbi:WD40 repeat domain-containing protein [Dictyobacter aurantiacus]|uniref:Anaphase-promoting complex subunit 4 WD40 domain-containing protein n=1 Tax=Dictyobacter aurantiacus TaxID=1936993 RepID=A0A401ZDS6_9CHLR|nr:WD40 repeat domain-containing protein [Dictyobacter aurantiacus]GCE05034.1 hypothetical protein KDAU_23630 [Dictyobacter aurantiacus]